MDNTLFSCLTHNPQPLHIDHDFAAKSEWGKPLVNSLFTLGVMLASPSQAPLLTRERVSPLYFFSYTFIPLSSIAFPHIGIFCLTARKLSHFRRTVVLYPLCMSRATDVLVVVGDPDVVRRVGGDEVAKRLGI